MGIDIDTVDYNRKDIKTKLGYIFNVPDDYELNESTDNHLFGIIEIPYDIFNDKESTGGTRRKSQRQRPQQRRDVENPCQLALYSLITQLLGGRGPGRPQRAQEHLRNNIKDDIKNYIRTPTNGFDVNLKVKN